MGDYANTSVVKACEILQSACQMLTLRDIRRQRGRSSRHLVAGALLYRAGSPLVLYDARRKESFRNEVTPVHQCTCHPLPCPSEQTLETCSCSPPLARIVRATCLCCSSASRVHRSDAARIQSSMRSNRTTRISNICTTHANGRRPRKRMTSGRTHSLGLWFVMPLAKTLSFIPVW
jgi:hypothetical protein